MSTSRTPTSVSDDDMHAAWQQLRRRDWPSLPEIKRAAALYQLVRGAALRKAQGLPPEQPQATAAEASPAVQTPAPSRPAHVPHALPHPPRQPPLFDHKRAAAGEREDD